MSLWFLLTKITLFPDLGYLCRPKERRVQFWLTQALPNSDCFLSAAYCVSVMMSVYTGMDFRWLPSFLKLLVCISVGGQLEYDWGNRAAFSGMQRSKHRSGMVPERIKGPRCVRGESQNIQSLFILYRWGTLKCSLFWTPLANQMLIEQVINNLSQILSCYLCFIFITIKYFKCL